MLLLFHLRLSRLCSNASVVENENDETRSNCDSQFWQHLVKNSRRHHVLHNQSGKAEKAIHAYWLHVFKL
ncbi:hypothetical protein T11_7222 [Trichinella zimbabwensis]|uniref:Secreted protein n=1 Tax=Trichinella zimbabwensis TaxID=268475 RepID=A0A0V1I5E0_9BILA|nr:hypothetical protein T11_7222 [Trichinella zimbabwensis]